MGHTLLNLRTSQILMTLNVLIFEGYIQPQNVLILTCSCFFKHPNLSMAKITIKYAAIFLFVNFPASIVLNVCFLTNIGLTVLILERVVEEISSNLKNSSNLLLEFESNF